METYYINILTWEPYTTIAELNSLLAKKKINLLGSNLAQDSDWMHHLIVEISSDKEIEISDIISDIKDIKNVEEVIDMEETGKEVKFLFNINCNCKKTLKKISRKPDRIVETDKELIYIHIIKRKKRDMFLQELSNLQLPYTQRIIWLTSH